MGNNENNSTKPEHDVKLPITEQIELLATFLDWLVQNPEKFKPNKPSEMLAEEFLNSR